jgi:O-antigen ligase
MTRWDRATGLFKDPNVFGPFLAPAFIYALSRLSREPLRKALLPLAVLPIVGLAVLLSFSRGAWFNLGVATAVFGFLHVVTARRNVARLRFLAMAATAALAGATVVLTALQFDAVADLFAERATLTQSYDEGPAGRFGGQEKAARLAIVHPFGIGAQQFAPHYHHEEPHNVYLAMFLNAGWLGGLIFQGLVGSTGLLGLRHALVRGASQPLLLVVLACFIGNALEGAIIDIDHWRHFYLLMAMFWGIMLSRPVSARR